MEIKLKDEVVQVGAIQPTEVETYLQQRLEEMKKAMPDNPSYSHTLGGYVLVGLARELQCEDHLDTRIGFGNLMRTATIPKGGVLIEYNRLFRPSRESLSLDEMDFLADVLPENLPEEIKKTEMELVDLIKRPHRLIEFGIRLRIINDKLYYAAFLFQDYHQLPQEKQDALRNKYEQLITKQGIVTDMEYRQAIDKLLELVPVIAEEVIDIHTT